MSQTEQLADPSPASRGDANLEFAFGVMATLVVHAALLVAALVMSVPEPEEARSFKAPVIDVELLKWGEVMPEDGQLPWIANPEPAEPTEEAPPASDPKQAQAPPDEETVELEPKPDEAPKPRREERLEQQPKPTPRDAPPTTFRGPTDPSRPTNNLPVMGSRDGVQGGTSLSAEAQRNQFSRIVAQLQRVLRKPANTSDTECARLAARVKLRVTVQGRISQCDLDAPTGNPLFDSSVRTMCNAFMLGQRRLDLGSITDEALREDIERRGFIANVKCQ
jgi:hypothetical protein